MRIVMLANGRPATGVARCLLRAGDEVSGLIIHPADQQRQVRQLLEVFGKEVPTVLEADASREPDRVRHAVENWRPDLLLSVFYAFRVPSSVLSCAPGGGVNLHPSLLPYHRGRHPNVWTLIEGTPAGATLHHMADSVDTGDVIARTELAVMPTDTAQTLYQRLEDACVALFERTWPMIRTGTAPRVPQSEFPEPPCSHRARDLHTLDEIDLDASYTGHELLALLRARTFPPHPSAWFRDGNRKIYVRVELADGGYISEAPD